MISIKHLFTGKPMCGYKTAVGAAAAAAACAFNSRAFLAASFSTVDSHRLLQMDGHKSVNSNSNLSATNPPAGAPMDQKVATFLDNMNYYRNTLSSEWKREHTGQYVVVDKCKVAGVFDNYVVALSFSSANNMFDSYMIRVGHEHEPMGSKPEHILPLDASPSGSSLYGPYAHVVLEDLKSKVGDPTKFVWKYHPHECQMIDVANYVPIVAWAGYGRLIMSVALQTKEMASAKKCMPVTCLVDTGPDVKFHGVVFDRLEKYSEQLVGRAVFLPVDLATGLRNVIINQTAQKASEVSRFDNKLEGVNIFGWSLISSLGLRVDGIVQPSSGPVFHFTKDMVLHGEVKDETSILYTYKSTFGQ